MRTVFILAALLGGFGVAAYVVAWLLIPRRRGRQHREHGQDRPARHRVRPAGLGSLLVVVLLIALVFGARPGSAS